MRHTTLISGATSGIGEACARTFAERGDILVLLGRNEEQLLELEKEFAPITEVSTFAVDVRDRAALEEVITGLPDLFSHPTILVNNAGLALGLDKAQTANGDDWDAMIDTNVRGFAHLARLVLKTMVAEGRGHIVNMGSVAGSYPYPGGNVYGATKSFVEQFSLNLRADLLGTPIRVTNIEPGMVETNFSRVRYRGDNTKADALYKDLQVLSPEDIAGIVRWVTEQPAHVNVNRLEVMSVAQSFSPFTLDRKPAQ